MTSYDERITTYFGDAVLRAGFMPVPHLLMRHYHKLGLQSDHAMFVMQLMEITWDLGDAPATIKKIAERMGVSVRTVQRYSEYLAARDLLVIYEQFEHGAQVENGYDLSPLFARLAELAPEPPLNGTPRERRRRGGLAAPQTGQSVAPTTSPTPRRTARPGVTPATQGGVTNDTGGADTRVTGARVTAVTPTPDARIIRPLSPSSGLNGVKNPPKNHQEPKGAGGGVPHPGSKEAGSPDVGTGWSLRWRQTLTAAEVMSTRAVLEHFGLHADIALAVASTLAPAEAWALGAYATGARLGPGWIATQVFAFDTRQPRTAALARRYDEAGRVLAALPPPDALQALGMVDQWCPDAPEQALAALGAAGIDPPICLAVRTLWPIVNELRRGRIPTLDPLAGGRPGGGAAPLSPDEPSEARELWQTVRAELQATIPAAEFATWLEHVTLLDVDGERAVIGAPNVFVRERVDVHYLPLITRALSNAVGRPVQAQTAIGG